MEFNLLSWRENKKSFFCVFLPDLRDVSSNASEAGARENEENPLIVKEDGGKKVSLFRTCRRTGSHQKHMLLLLLLGVFSLFSVLKIG